ncbi:peptidylprolyl isomerase [Consotaella salsifontis]|uniref:Parvulin-like PPIase n=1 Tax=Consotaella salsifontis TaxID=1365950 RepID=A0A1T4T0F9_9HYPH|nr:peptidylprolyl isomerase [Consotaella salsifontis]SKA33731.1 peptidyl-prolyl cis-trans isomerase D [Consotaella salsifontis]
MMDSLRKAAGSWVAKLLLGLLVISFGVWGIADVFRGTTPTTVISAGDTEVSIRDYVFTYQRAQMALSQQMGRRLTKEEAQQAGVDQQVLSQLVADAVLSEQARHLNLGLSQDRLADLIAEDPSFHDQNGNFSRGAFRQVLNQLGLNEDAYIENRAKAAVRSQIVDVIAEGTAAPSVIDTAIGLYNGERRTVDYLMLPPSLVQPVATPDADALHAYFEDHKASYAAPEYRSIAYAELTPEAIADPAAVSSEQVQQDYDNNRARFTTPERRHVQQLVFPNEDAAKAAKAKIDAGASFEDVAKEAGRSLADTDLGLVAKGDIADKTIADAAFNVESGKVSDVVPGIFGPALVRVTEVQPEAVRPLSEVEDAIRRDLAREGASDAVLQAYDTYEDARASGATFEEATKKAGIDFKTVAAVDRAGRGPDGKPVEKLPESDELLKAAFDSEVGLDNAPINVPSASGYVFYDVKSVEPAHDRSLEDVHDQVVADWQEQETQRLLAERSKAYLERLQKGDSLTTIAVEAGLVTSTATGVSRQSAATDLGPAGANAAFSGKTGYVAEAPAPKDSRVLLKVTAVNPPADPASSVTAEQRQRIAEMMKNDLYQSYIGLMQQEYTVRMNPKAVEQAQVAVR